MAMVIDASRSPKTHEVFVKQYGRNIRIRGFLPWDQRLFTLDPVSLTHVMKHSNIYEKPWQSRDLITSLIGCGMLAAEGQVHKRQRRVATPAFSVQNMRALVPVVFAKGNELKDRWFSMIADAMTADAAESEKVAGAKIDVCHWVSRATFDVIGLAGFDYHFNAIQNETNDCTAWDVVKVYLPIIDVLFPSEKVLTVRRCHKVIERVAGRLIREKKTKISEAEKNGSTYQGKDLLSLLLKSNVAVDLPPQQRISDKDILHNINTFMFAGSDTSSLSITWTLLLLAKYPTIQTRLRKELLSISPAAPLESLTQEEVGSLYATIADLPYLENVVRESLRMIPPVHSSLRVATQDDDVPISSPVKLHMADGRAVEEMRSIRVSKGSFVHVPIEAFNLDREVWGPDGWQFNPDRWDNLPESVSSQPGLYNNILTFSAGPRSCIGMRFSIIEMKTFLYILLTNFVYSETTDKVGKANVVLTRPSRCLKWWDECDFCCSISFI
ncbi:hypothetical protein A0H81_08492 [Grifola frondosa]|uniref:Cytochrome P450 n=1 Tax=Grifola frondosa TaxID=5627 RepID=A0A1C7M3G8_GRIFR|nr:hypothetical protein A0H81_08492 [Grifola frondosa]